MMNPTRTLLVLAGLFLAGLNLSAHCQVPCGIYADDVVFGELMTDVDTIRKAMTQIDALGSDAGSNPNQLVRWVNNKEAHAQNIQDTMSAYFLAQRIKLSLKESNPKEYARLVGLAHQVTVLAMKCKQGTDLEKVDALEAALEAFHKAYSK
jgi:hypothetical protein